MIVLHALWDRSGDARLHFWAESSQQSAGAARRGRRTSVMPGPQPHPFALSAELVREALGELGESLLAREAVAGVKMLRLPATTRGPLASPELVREEVAELSATAFAVWEVPTLALDAAGALDLLLALPSTPSTGIAFGSALRFWIIAARLAFELLARQCYVPALHTSVEGDETSVCAAWDALLDAEDSARVNSLAALMPPVCWSLVPGDERPSTLPQDLLLHFLHQTIDAFVRARLAFHNIVPETRKRWRKLMPLPEQWLRGLASTDPALEAEPDALQPFVAVLRAWLDQLRVDEKDAAFRTCFRLDPPGEKDGEESEPLDWQVSFYLQANDDRSLLVPAENVWQERSSTLTFLKRTFENPQERLLADLGRASRFFPAIEESLKMAHPSGLVLDTTQAYTFLRESAPLLEQSGFGVLIPSWWQKPAARLGVKLKIKPKAGPQTASGLLGLESIVSYDWTLSIGDMTLTAVEFENLVRLKLPLIQVRGQWVELHPEEIERAIAFFQKKRRAGSMTLSEALRTGLTQGQSELGLPVTDIDSEGWIKDLLAQLADNGKIAPIDAPTTFHGQLRPYQLKGVSWLAFLRHFGFGGCLADDMGMGKTIQLIALLLHGRGTRSKKHLPGQTLLICPMSIVGNWQRELQRFAPSLSVMIHHGHERLSGEAFVEEARQHDVVITTYALALRDREHLAELDWEYVVVDEAQNIKNEFARQTQAIKSLSARHRVALTGTPVENRLSELWSIMEFLNPGYLGSATDFRQNFAIPIERYHDKERADVLKRVIQPFVLRRVKTDKSIIADLPDKLEMKVLCNLTQEQASLYEAVVKEMMEKIESAEEEMERRGLILATLLRLKQVCNHPAQFIADSSRLPGRSGKLARLEEMLEEVLATGEKALIFSQFSQMGTLLRRHLQETFGSEVLFLHGAVPKKQRDSMVQRFQEQRSAQIFILSLKAGGVGLNLTAANHVFHFDRWWNPAVENQATDRAFRIGQTKNVQVHKFVCVGTLEERIDLMIEQKKELAENIVGSGENWLTEMSTAQLKELFALSREAVGE